MGFVSRTSIIILKKNANNHLLFFVTYHPFSVLFIVLGFFFFVCVCVFCFVFCSCCRCFVVVVVVFI